jgi:Asp-tRNA(Asn)/Glu-tRNA(Gln) amidotransferase A subunit family amidase
VKCTIQGSDDPHSKLYGRTIAIKDNIAVAGIPLMNGTDYLRETFTPGINFKNENKTY